MNVSLQGFEEKYVTFPLGEGAKVGQTVSLDSGQCAVASAAGDGFAGVLTAIRGGLALVQLRGTCTLAFSGESQPTDGYNHFVADGAGGVKVSAAGRPLLVVEIHENTLTLIL